MEIRRCEPGELARCVAPIFHYFGRVPDPERLERLEPFLAPERVHVAQDGGAIVGAAGAFSLVLTVPGARVPAAGVTVVGVLPTHRRRGVLTRLMRAQLEEVRARGETIAALWASDDRIYGRYGYGMASFSGAIDVPTHAGAFRRRAERLGAMRLLSAEEALELLSPVYERVARRTPGMLERSTEWWRARLLADPEWRRGGAGEQARVLLEGGDGAVGYALYRLHVTSEDSSTEVIEAVGTSPAATEAVWRYLLDLDLSASLRAELLPVDHPLPHLVAQPRRLGLRIADGLWIRLVDVGAALGLRGYASGEPVVLAVTDAFVPANAGRWRLAEGQATRTQAGADVALDVSELGSVYLGGFTFAQLGRAGKVEELRPGGLARADALFRTDTAPWCPEIF